MKQWIKSIYKKLPWNIRDYIRYCKYFKCVPNMRKPKKFSEKMLCRKQYDCRNNPMYTRLADKYQVREFVKAKIGEQFLMPLAYVVDDVDALDALRLNLNEVVIKPTHGASMVHFYNTVPEAAKLAEDKQLFRQWLNTDFSQHSGEYHYQAIPRRLMIEHRVRGESEHLIDYKFHLFRQPNGEYWYVLHMIGNRFNGELKHDFYINDLSSEVLAPLRAGLEEALALSLQLLNDIDYARLDWYIVNGKPLFGEFTFTPAAGFVTYLGDELDQLMGEKWHYQKPNALAQPTPLRSA